MLLLSSRDVLGAHPGRRPCSQSQRVFKGGRETVHIKNEQLATPRRTKMDVLRNLYLFVKTKSTTSHLSKQLCNHPAKPSVLHNTQWIFITSRTCFLPSSLALPGQLHPREQSNNTFYFFLSKNQRMKKDVDINLIRVL